MMASLREVVNNRKNGLFTVRLTVRGGESTLTVSLTVKYPFFDFPKMTKVMMMLLMMIVIMTMTLNTMIT